MSNTATEFVRLGSVPIQFELENGEPITAAPEKVDVKNETILSVIQIEVEGVETFARITGLTGEETLSFELPSEPEDFESMDDLLQADDLYGSGRHDRGHREGYLISESKYFVPELLGLPAPRCSLTDLVHPVDVQVDVRPVVALLLLDDFVRLQRRRRTRDLVRP